MVRRLWRAAVTAGLVDLEVAELVVGVRQGREQLRLAVGVVRDDRDRVGRRRRTEVERGRRRARAKPRGDLLGDRAGTGAASDTGFAWSSRVYTPWSCFPTSLNFEAGDSYTLRPGASSTRVSLTGLPFSVPPHFTSDGSAPCSS